MRLSLALAPLLALVGVVAALPKTRADDAPRPPTAPPDTTERRRVLANGLEVIAIPSSRAKGVVVVTTFRAGPRDESKDESGASQLVARLYRRSAAGARSAGSTDAELSALAASVAPNAAVSLVGHEVRHDAIAFFATAPEDKLASILEVEHDRMASLAPLPEVLEDARSEVVFESAKAEGKTSTRAWNTLLALAYGDCGLGRPKQGSSHATSALTLKALEDWRHAHLRPDTTLVVIAGAHDADAALEKAARILGTIPRPADPLPPRGVVAPAAPGALRAAIEGPAASREVLMGYRGPESGGEDEAAFLALALELKDRVNAAEKGVAHETSVGTDLRTESPSLLTAVLEPRPNASVADLESRATAAVASIRDETLPAIAPIRDRVQHALMGLTRPLDPVLAAHKDDPGTLVQLACDRAEAEPLVRRREALLKRLAALTPEGLRDAAHFYLADERQRVVVVGEK